MLLKFRFSNFRSFRTEQELSLIASKLPGSGDGLFSPPGLTEQVLPVAAIYGANASGKTAVIDALGCMTEAIKWSHTHWQPDAPVPVESFAGEKKTTPSEFVIDFLLQGVRHQYGFAATRKGIVREWLYVYPKGKPQLWFERLHGHPISFGAKLPGENRMIEGLVRANSLFLSAAAQNNHEALFPVYAWFSRFPTPIMARERRAYSADVVQLCQNEHSKRTIIRLLSHADLGVSDVLVDEMPPSSPPVTAIRLAHRIDGTEIPFAMHQESNGTLAYLSLIGPIMWGLRNGAVLCVDELDASLHPLMAVQIIRLFSSAASNPLSAQLVFNTHDTNLLSSGDLRRDQIWFTEKDSSGTSHLYPLTDFRPRRQENLENGYLQGRYGAIPFIHPDYLSGKKGGNGEKS